jgi:RNA polymerase sigma-70 factor (ECF subfamily)
VACDGLALGEILVAEYRALMSYSRRLTANRAEAKDLVQMLCARVLACGAVNVSQEHLPAWLRTVLFRLFIDLRRRSRREIPIEHEVADTTPPTEPEPRFQAVTLDDVRALLTALPAHYRVPYEMFSFEGLSYEQISTRLGLPCRTVGSRINRARTRLRSLFAARGV